MDIKTERTEDFQRFIHTEVNSKTTAHKYDKWAGQYDKDVKTQEYGGPKKLAEIFDKELGQAKDAAIVDWAAGTGLVGIELYDRGFTNLTALDISQKSLDIAEQKGVYKRLMYVDPETPIEKLFGEDEVDAIVNSGAIMPNCVKPEVFHDWTRIVKPGGVILIVARLPYLELTEGFETYYNEKLATEFERVVQDLEDSGRWEKISRNSFPGFIGLC